MVGEDQAGNCSKVHSLGGLRLIPAGESISRRCILAPAGSDWLESYVANNDYLTFVSTNKAIFASVHDAVKALGWGSCLALVYG